MNVFLQYVLGIVCTIVAHLIVTYLAGAVTKLGAMMTVGLHGATSSTFAKGLRDDDLTPVVLKGFIRAQLLGALPGAAAAIVLCIVAALFIAGWFPYAAWIPDLWAFGTILYALSLIRQSLWWFVKSFFSPPESLLEDMMAWHAKHSG